MRTIHPDKCQNGNHIYNHNYTFCYCSTTNNNKKLVHIYYNSVRDNVLNLYQTIITLNLKRIIIQDTFVVYKINCYIESIEKIITYNPVNSQHSQRQFHHSR